MKFTIPIKTVSESNMREHWAPKSKRVAQQRGSAFQLTRSEQNKGRRFPPKPWRITLTRIGKRRLDTGNNPSSMKHIQDGICDALGIDDGDESNDWIYHQRIEKTYAVEVEIVTK